MSVAGNLTRIAGPAQDVRVSAARPRRRAVSSGAQTRHGAAIRRHENSGLQT
jgi:hypothetical protein